VFLAALGVDYNRFLSARSREEAGLVGLRKGMLRRLGVTGGVITAAGLIMAGCWRPHPAPDRRGRRGRQRDRDRRPARHPAGPDRVRPGQPPHHRRPGLVPGSAPGSKPEA
jgi:hypothetical protein